MFRHKEFIMFIYLSFTIAYALFGDPNIAAWSCAYFLSNYLIMLMLFNNERNKTNRIIGKALCFSMLLFVVLRYFFGFGYDRIYSIIPFVIALFWIYKKETP